METPKYLQILSDIKRIHQYPIFMCEQDKDIALYMCVTGTSSILGLIQHLLNEILVLEVELHEVRKEQHDD